MKTSTFIVGALFICAANFVSAQTNSRLVQAPNPATTTVYMDRLMSSNIGGYVAPDDNNLDSYRYNFEVTFKDNTVKQVHSKIFIDPKTIKTYLVFEDKSLPKNDPKHTVKIYSDETLNIMRVRKNDNGDSTHVYGMAGDSCWMFKAVKGAISVYSFLSEDVMDNTFDARTIIGLQLKNGPIVPFTKENLAAMLLSDFEATKLFGAGNVTEAIQKFNSDHQ